MVECTLAVGNWVFWFNSMRKQQIKILHEAMVVLVFYCIIITQCEDNKTVFLAPAKVQ